MNASDNSNWLQKVLEAYLILPVLDWQLESYRMLQENVKSHPKMDALGNCLYIVYTSD